MPAQRVERDLGTRSDQRRPATGGSAEPALGTWLRRFGLYLEVGLSVSAGVAAALLQSADVVAVAVLALIWVGAAYHRGSAVASPAARQLRTLVHSSVLCVAASAVAIAFLSAPLALVTQALSLSLVGASVAALCRVLRWRLQAPVRIVVVGDRVAVAQSVARWAGKSGMRVVGGVVVEPDLHDDEVPSDIMGVPVMAGLDSTTGFARQLRTDLIVVSPGPGFTGADLRQLGWALEDTGIRYAVAGVLDAVAAHRIVPGGLGGATLLDVRVPRPSWPTRVLKDAVDRVAAAVLLVLCLPLLLATAIAVRAESPGSPIFTQRRVGRGGRLFTVYKLRTMVAGAEEIKTQLTDRNEHDGVLFKMRRDPRVTRLGRILRALSIDELPQLLNVVRGEMSLVGPRPHLPAEVELMAPHALRRHAVKPGITGLWQVSGRSDLSHAESTELDTFYADNWSLTGDATICLRTVSAVVRRQGAY